MVQGMSVQARDGASREQLEAVVEAAMTAWPKRDLTERPTKKNASHARARSRSRA
jgi:hypothetical protein